MTGTVHYLDLAVVHCGALTGMKWSVLDRLEKIMHLHCCRLLIVTVICFPIFLLVSNLVITHYYLSWMFRLAPKLR